MPFTQPLSKEQADTLGKLEALATAAVKARTDAEVEYESGKMTLENFTAFLAHETQYQNAAENYRRSLGGSNVAGALFPGDIGGRGTAPTSGLTATLRDNPELARQPQGAIKTPNIIEAALARPTGFGMAIDGGSLGARRVQPSFIADMPRRRLSILDYIPKGPDVDDLGGTVLEYFRVDTRTNAAAVVAAGAEKPESALTVSRQNTSLYKYAHISEAIPQEFLIGKAATWGGTGLQSFVEVDMAMSVMESFETDCLSGDGSGKPDGITHIANTGATASTGDPIADIRRAIGSLEAQNIAPDLIVVSIEDSQKLDLETDGQGRYHLGGPLDPEGSRIWRLPVVPTTGLAEGEAVVGAFGIGCVRWMGYSLLSWGTINDDHQHNQLRLVAEAGCGFAVVRPACFNIVAIA